MYREPYDGALEPSDQNEKSHSVVQSFFTN